MGLDVVELKKRIIDLLREDEEFRLAVTGLLGLDAILLELKKLREDFNKFIELEEKRWEENRLRWEEQERRWEENNRRWEENNKRWEELNKRWEENNKRWEENWRRWEEQEKRWEENNKRWEEAYRRFEAIEAELARLSKAVAEIGVVLGSIGRRWGRDLERAVLEIYRHALEERGIEPGKVEKFVYVDSEGKYYKKGARIEVDIYVHDERLYLIEVKSHAEYEDVEWFHDVSKIVEKVLGREADKLILVAVHIDEEALERARELGMDVIYGAAIP